MTLLDESVTAAKAYLAACEAINGDTRGVPDDDPRWDSMLAAARTFDQVTGLAFCAEREDVVNLLLAIAAEVSGDK